MSFLIKRDNQAIEVNDYRVSGYNADADISITTHGSDWYWTVCACMIVATLAFVGLGLTQHRSKRIFHYITASITMVAAIAYFSMGSNLGWTPVAVEFVRSERQVQGATREIFYVRYIDWVITTPLLLLDLLLTAGLPTPTILFVILIDEVMIVTGLVGALVSSSYKWGYFAFGCAALLYILYVLVIEARVNANTLGADVGRTFLTCGALTSLLWTLYPIAWGVCEGGNVIGADGEAIFYGILDLFAKPVFGALLIFGHRNIDPARLGLHIQDYTEKDAHVHNKNGAAPVVGNNGVAGTTNPTTTETV